MSARVMERSMPGRTIVFWNIWHVIALLLVVLAPSQLWLGRPFWLLPPPEMLQGASMGVVYLALALFLSLREDRGFGSIVVAAGCAGLALSGTMAMLLSRRGDLPHSRAVLALSIALAVSLAVLPRLMTRFRVSILAGLGFALAALPLIGTYPARRRSADDVTRRWVVETSLHPVAVRYYHRLVRPPVSDGGALAAYRNGFVLVTGSGEFYRLSWDATVDSLRAVRLALPAPMDRRAFLADQPDSARAPRLRVTGLEMDTTVVPVRLYVAHQHWNHQERCFTMRVSSAPLPGDSPTDAGHAPEWTTVSETHPCLERSASFTDVETGGRLAWDPQHRLLLSVGDHGLSGLNGPALAQRMDGDYGKVLRLDRAGRQTIFTLGHRNPQGLLTDRAGRIWETEHGQQGGDELNLLVEGKNYGWPLATYGTDYGRTTWPLAEGRRDHGQFTEPVYAFEPSIGISNLIQLGGKQFPAWKDDLLIASLRAQTLFRVRLRDERLIYAEPIPLGSRIRDLKEGSDGRILIWTDDGDLIVLAQAPLSVGGELVYHHDCRNCHEPGEGGVARGPSLKSLLGRQVASIPNYRYSPALLKLGGKWTAERLNEFLRNPNAYAPGTAMEYGGLSNAADRQNVIEFLRNKYQTEGQEPVMRLRERK
jgi:cytochrome c2